MIPSFVSADGLQRGGSVLTAIEDGSGTVRLFLPCGPSEDVTAAASILLGCLRTEPIVVTLDQVNAPHEIVSIAGASVSDRATYDGETFEIGAVAV